MGAVCFRDTGYAVVERLIAKKYMEETGHGSDDSEGWWNREAGAEHLHDVPAACIGCPAQSPAAPREDAEDVDKDDERKAPGPPTSLTG